MKQAAVLWMALVSAMILTACVNAGAVTDSVTTITLECGESYDETDPFIHEKLFCLSEDLPQLTATGSLEMDGGQGTLEVKNNRTDEVLWSAAWEGDVPAEAFSLSLENLKEADEYVLCFTGFNIKEAAIEVSFESGSVQERERPAQ